MARTCRPQEARSRLCVSLLLLLFLLTFLLHSDLALLRSLSFTRYGFAGMCLLRSLGDAALASPEGAALLGSFGAEEWRAAAAVVGDTMGSRWLLGTAMAAVGLGTSASALKGVGFRPFAVGMAGASAVGATGMASALAVGAIL